MMSGFYNSVLFLFLLFTDSPLLLRDALGNGMGGTAWGFGVQFFVWWFCVFFGEWWEAVAMKMGCCTLIYPAAMGNLITGGGIVV
jgi:hypothetical protein